MTEVIFVEKIKGFYENIKLYKNSKLNDKDYYLFSYSYNDPLEDYILITQYKVNKLGYYITTRDFDFVDYYKYLELLLKEMEWNECYSS